jgi:hypothetical protein
VWRMHCRCRFRAGKPGEIAACGCGFWWRVSKGGRWYAISKRRAFRALMPGLMRELGYLEVTGRWPAKLTRQPADSHGRSGLQPDR